MHADKQQSFLQVNFNTLGIKAFYKGIFSLLMGMIKHSQSPQSNLLFGMSQLLISRRELTKCNPSISIESSDHSIYPGLSILFLYAPAHKTWFFEKFLFQLEHFSYGLETDCFLVWQLMSLNKETMVSSGKFYFFISWSPICTPLIFTLVSMKIARTL